LEKSSSCSSKENLQQAFDIAEKEFGVTKLLDPEDVDVIAPDERSILTYVSLLYDAMPNIPIHPNQVQKEKVNF
jgi:plectin